MKWYITNEAHSADLVMIISYPASPSRIIVLLKTLRHIIDNLKKKSERKERSFREKRRKGIIFLANAINNQRLLRATSWYEFEPIWSKLKLTSYSRCLGLHARTVHVIVTFSAVEHSVTYFPFIFGSTKVCYVLIRFGIKKTSLFKGHWGRHF